MAEDPVHLFDESGSELLKSLFSAAREEQPSAQALQRTLTAIGVGSALGVTASAASGTSTVLGQVAGTPAVAGGASLASAKSVVNATLLVVLKWLGVGAVAGLLATSAIYAVSEPALPTQSTARTAIADGRLTPKAPVPLGAPRPAAAEPELRSEPEAVSAPAAASAAPAASAVALAPQPLAVPAEVDPGAPLAAELALLDDARQALAAGNAAGAMRSLNDYDVRFTHPNLAPEALYLRLEALTLQGDKAGTEAVARRLLRSYPSGPHAARARSVLGLAQ